MDIGEELAKKGVTLQKLVDETLVSRKHRRAKDRRERRQQRAQKQRAKFLTDITNFQAVAKAVKADQPRGSAASGAGEMSMSLSSMIKHGEEDFEAFPDERNLPFDILDFDDTGIDIRSPREWAQLIGAAGSRGLRGRALRIEAADDDAFGDDEGGDAGTRVSDFTSNFGIAKSGLISAGSIGRKFQVFKIRVLKC